MFKPLISLLLTISVILSFSACATVTSVDEQSEYIGELVEYTSDNILVQTVEAKDFLIERAVFVGDSNIAHLRNYKLVSDSQIWTGSECYLTLEPDVCRRFIVYPETGEQMTIAAATARKKPEYIVITLGTDGALLLDRKGFRLSYTGLLDSIKEASPDTLIIVQSIFPVRYAQINRRFDNPEAANRKFAEANEWLRELAEEYSVKYLDTQSILRDESGMLRADYNTDHLDGYHLNKSGLLAMLGYIKENARINT